MILMYHLMLVLLNIHPFFVHSIFYIYRLHLLLFVLMLIVLVPVVEHQIVVLFHMFFVCFLNLIIIYFL